MRPPVVPGIASAKIPWGASTAFRMSCTGRCQSALSHWTGRQLLREVEGLRGADQVLLRGVLREHRTHLVLLAVEPGDEEHLRRPAAVPVALLEVRRDAADAGAEALHVHGGVGGMALRGDRHLVLRGRRAAGRAHLAVRPGLLLQPVEHVGAVAHGRAEDVVVALGEEVAALVLDHERVAALDRARARASCRPARRYGRPRS